MPATESEPQSKTAPPIKSVVAQAAYACPACGGDAHWNPAKRSLVCASCGTVLPRPEHAGVRFKFTPRPVDEGLRDASDQVKDTRLAVMCGNCHAVSHFDAGTAADRCSFCGSTAIVPYETFGDHEHPQCVVPFLFGEDEARDIASKWYRTLWLAPRKFKKAAHIDTMRGIYLPFWNFNADGSAQWTTDKNRSGDVEMHFDSLLVCAASDAPDELITEIEPFPGEELRAFGGHYVAGWTVGRYQRGLALSRDLAHVRMNEMMLARVRQNTRGEKNVGTIQISGARYANETYAQTLLPVWLLQYTYFGKSFALLINGATGKAEGRSPKSWFKLALVWLLIAWVVVFSQDPEVALKLPFWIFEGLWSLLTLPFTRRG